jgi:hypothetical protein
MPGIEIVCPQQELRACSATTSPAQRTTIRSARAHNLNPAPGGLGHHRVAVADAGSGHDAIDLTEAVEWGQDRLQRRPLGIQGLVRYP